MTYEGRLETRPGKRKLPASDDRPGVLHASGPRGKKYRNPLVIDTSTRGQGDFNLKLSHTKLRQHLHYDPETGVWTRRVDSAQRGNFWAGDRADIAADGGYRIVILLGKTYRAHALALFYVTKVWPAELTDHRDCTPSNNKFKNIRPASSSQNRANVPKQKNNTSGFKGVQKVGKKWLAKITAQGICYNLGRFNDPRDAHAAYVAAAEMHFGEFARGE
jgi:hypothetical protein